MSQAISVTENGTSERTRPHSKRYYTCEECGKSAKNRVLPSDHDTDEYTGPQVRYFCNNHIAQRYDMDISEASRKSGTQIAR